MLALVVATLVPLTVLTPRADAADLAFADVAAGRAHSCALTTTGYVWCWGANNRGQLGVGDEVAEATAPMVVPGLHDVSAITAGANHTCAVVGDVDGDLLECWGANNTGQLGLGSTADEETPQPVPDLVGVSSVAAGRQHTCAVTDGGDPGARTWCWGSNSFGQLGNGEIVDADFAAFVSQQGQIATDDAGNVYVLDVTASGVRMFSRTGEYVGSPGSGLLDPQAVSLAVRSTGGTPTMLFAGAGQEFVQWVDPATHQNGTWPVCADLGLTACNGFVGVALSMDQEALYVTASSAGGSAVGRYLIDQDPGDADAIDPVLEWADQPTYDVSGGLVPFPLAGDLVAGPGPQGREQVYVALARPPAAPVVSVYGSDGARTKNVNVGITAPCTDGSAADRAWGVGLNADGELGLAVVATGADPDGPGLPEEPPVEGWCVETRDSSGALASRFGGPSTTEPGEIGTVVDVAGSPDGSWFLADADHETILKASPDGEVDFGWGHAVFRSVPQEVRLLGEPWGADPGAPVTDVFAGTQHSCAISGRTICWGADDAGQVEPDPPAGSSTFLTQAQWGNGARSGDGGDQQSCVTQSFGIQCWGGDEAPTFVNSPADPEPDVAVGNGFRCLAIDGEVGCTSGPGGAEADGQLGDGGTSCVATPGHVQACDGSPAPISGVSQVAAGNAHACAVADLGTAVYCWGRNTDHQVSAASAAAVDHAVEVSFPTAPDVQVGFEGPSTGAPEPPVTVSFSPPVDNVTPENVGVDGHDLQAGVVLALTGGPSGGTFDVTVGPETATVPFSASGSDLATALETLDGVGPGDVEVGRAGSGSDADPFRYTVRLLGALAGAPPAITADGDALTGPSAPYAVGVAPLGLRCQDADGADVDCAEGPVSVAQLVPEGLLDCGTDLTGTVNDGALDDQDRVLWGGFVVDPATSGPLPAPCPDVRITGPDVSSPDTELLVPKAGPFVLRFPRPVQHVTPDGVEVTAATGGAPVQVPLAGITCRAAGGAEVSCDEGPVRRADLLPTAPLACDGSYDVAVNGSGAAEDGLRWGAFVLQPTSSPTLSVDCDGVIVDPGPDPTTATYRWGKVKATKALGKRYLLESEAGATASYTFTGKRLTWLTVLGPKMGKARVAIDGDPVATVNNYAKRRIMRAAWRYPGLGPGEHTVTITATGVRGARRAASTGVAIDAFQVGKKKVRNPKVTSTWASRPDAAAVEGTADASQVKGARAVVRFEGTRLAWGTLRGPAQGTARIKVDGEVVRTVRNYRAGETTARTVVLGNLAPGPHVATIVVTGQGKGRRTGAGTFVTVDTLDAS